MQEQPGEGHIAGITSPTMSANGILYGWIAARSNSPDEAASRAEQHVHLDLADAVHSQAGPLAAAAPAAAAPGCVGLYSAAAQRISGPGGLGEPWRRQRLSPRQHEGGSRPQVQCPEGACAARRLPAPPF